MKVTDQFVLFFGNNDICSNFFLCNITYNGRRFTSSEQLFMYLKAKFFKDEEIAEEIYKGKSPREAKALGRMIKKYDDKAWNAERDNIMLTALSAKFDSFPQFRRFLEEHKDKTFVEASPYDNIWGIKLPENHPDALNPSKWRGENRLGKCINKLIELKLW